jgi:hypothetical protein
MGHGKSWGSFDGPPIFFCMSAVGPPNKNRCMSTSKNKDNNKSKQNYPHYQMQMMLLKPVLCLYTTTRSGRITANTTNWRAAQYRNW